MNNPADTRRADAGFALVDALVALVLLGVVASLMALFLGQARSLLRLSEEAAVQMEIEAATRFVEASIASAERLPLLDAAEPDGRVRYFEGSAGSARFSAILPNGFNSVTLQQVAISGGNGQAQTGSSLTLAAFPRRLAVEVRPVDAISILPSPARIEFEYFDASLDRWAGEWLELRRLPDAVRFRILVRRGGKEYRSDGYVDPALSD